MARCSTSSPKSRRTAAPGSGCSAPSTRALTWREPAVRRGDRSTVNGVDHPRYRRSWCVTPRSCSTSPSTPQRQPLSRSGRTCAFGGVDRGRVRDVDATAATAGRRRSGSTRPRAIRNELREQAFVPSIEVGANGELVVTYYDFRFDRSDGREAHRLLGGVLRSRPSELCLQRRAGATSRA